jgi:multidrug resistance efflux pump
MADNVAQQQPPSRSPAASLLEYERKLRQCRSLRELLFAAANETFGALRFDQAVVWLQEEGSEPYIGAVSGLAELTPDSPYVQWLLHALEYIRVDRRDAVSAFAYAELPEAIAEDGRDWVHEHLLHCYLHDPDGKVHGGLLFTRSDPFDESETAVAEWIASATGFALWAWRRERGRIRWLLRRPGRYLGLGLVALLAVLALVPVRLSALAPAEITPVRPVPITSPIEGVVARVAVQPNQIVRADQVLVELDDTSIRNRLEVARKAFQTARADYQRAVNKAFSDEASKGELLVLESRARERAAEGQYLSELLGRLKVTAPQGGIAVFTDAEDWRGRPVQPGERIMTVADPSLVGVTVYLPPEDAVQLELGSEVTVYLNIDPLSPIKAKIVQTSYEVTTLPDNTLAYIVKAELQPGYGLPRIGNRGTAKVYGEPVTLGYYLFRKPIVFLRSSLGI